MAAGKCFWHLFEALHSVTVRAAKSPDGCSPRIRKAPGRDGRYEYSQRARGLSDTSRGILTCCDLQEANRGLKTQKGKRRCRECCLANSETCYNMRLFARFINKKRDTFAAGQSVVSAAIGPPPSAGGGPFRPYFRVMGSLREELSSHMRNRSSSCSGGFSIAPKVLSQVSCWPSSVANEPPPPPSAPVGR